MNGRLLHRSLPLLPALIVLIALIAMLPADPASGVTISRSPFTDEGYDVLNARNLVLLGQWSTGDWNLHLVNGPFSAATAGIFQLLGVGLIPARLLQAVITALTVAVLGVAMTARFGARFGHSAGLIAGVALAGNALVLYYGRLALLEPMVTLFLVSAVAVLMTAPHLESRRLGLAGGGLLGLAVATKPSAAFAAFGILLGIALAGSIRDHRTRLRLAAALAGIAAVGIAWLVVIAVPNWSAVLTDLRIWAQPTAPADPNDLLVRIAKYAHESDRAIPYMLTLLVAAAAGVAFAKARWRTLDRGQRMLIGAAIGWFVAGMGLLLAADYRPNRYVLPVLPALAILAGVAAWEIVWRLPRSARMRVVAVAVLAVGLALPGASAYASWAGSATYRFRTAQSALERLVPPGEGIEGELAPIFGLRTHSPLFVSRPELAIDAGNLYVTHNVRWVVVTRGARPAWSFEAPEAWARSRTVFCVEWAGEKQCLVHIP